jgi:serine/threonine-protein kinase
MELVEGESLTEVIQRIGVAGMLDWRFAFRVAVHVGRALEYAHGKNILHRNLTPQNILVRAEDKVVKLGDLMLAKALEGTLAEQLTRPGEVLGDVRYMAPERTRGTEHIDARSDLYSLGALLYTLLTGRAPFQGGSLIETIQQIRTAEPARPRQFQMSIPDRFEALVLKLLSKRPELRFASATELLAELERIGKYHGVTG